MRDTKPGFSLIEIMVVVFLIAAVATMAAPQFFAALEKPSQAELRHLVRVIKLLRNESILGRNVYYIVFDIEEQTYSIELERKEGGRIELDTPQVLRPHTFPEEVQMEEVSLTLDDNSGGFSRSSILGTGELSPVEVRIDSSGFVTPFVMYLLEENQTWVIRTTSIMGHLKLEEGENAVF